MVRLTTSLGEITLELFADKAPISVANFLKYVESGFYGDTVFHRVIPGFMVQGGGMTANLEPKSGGNPPIKNEADNGLKNLRGTLSMARTSVVDSATSQFFINVADNTFLDYRGKNPDQFGYAVFGQVIEGTEVVDAMKGVKTGNKGGHSDVPLEPVTITSMKLVEE